MPTGEVFRYESSRGYGFIKPDAGGPDVFLHVKQLAPGQDPNRLRVGASVLFETTQSDKGLKALRVQLISKERRTPAFSPQVPDDGECDVLSEDEFRTELISLMSDERVAAVWVDWARKHGWVE